MAKFVFLVFVPRPLLGVAQEEEEEEVVGEDEASKARS